MTPSERESKRVEPAVPGPAIHWGTVLAVLVAAAASPWLHGYEFGWENHRMQIPYLRVLQDPTLFPGDPLVQAMGSYAGFFWPALAWLSAKLPIEPLFFALHILVLCAKYALILAIGRQLFPDSRRAAFFGLWLVFWGRSGIGAEKIHWIYLAHTPVATVLGLSAIWLALRSRWTLALLVAGLTFDLHAMQAAYVLLMVGVAFLFEARKPWKEIVLGGALFLLAAAPGIWLMSKAEVVGAPPDLPALVRAYFPYHYFPSSFRLGQWLALMILVGIYGVAHVFFASGGSSGARRGLRMCAALFGLWFVGGALTEVWPHPLLLKLHIFRSASYLTLLLLCLCGGIVSRMLSRLEERGYPSLLGPALLLVLPLYGSTEYLPRPSGLFVVTIALAGLSGGVALWGNGKKRRRASGVALACSAVIFGHGLLARVRWTEELPQQRAAWHEAQRWAHENTDPDERFLTPPYLEGFRIFSERPVVGESFDGAALLWSAAYADYWRDWYRDMGGEFDGERISCWDRLAREWFSMDQGQIEQLARDYDARYIVVREAKPREERLGWKLDWQGTPLFDNGVFRIYAAPHSGG